MARRSIHDVPSEVSAKLAELLTTSAQGMGNARSRYWLRAQLSRAGLPDGDRMVRRAIRGLIRDGLPVGGGYRGYWVCRDAADLAAAREEMMSRICALSKRARAVREAYVRTNGGQAELAFEPDAADGEEMEAALAVLAAAAREDEDDD